MFWSVVLLFGWAFFWGLFLCSFGWKISRCNYDGGFKMMKANEIVELVDKFSGGKLKEKDGFEFFALHCD